MRHLGDLAEALVIPPLTASELPQEFVSSFTAHTLLDLENSFDAPYYQVSVSLNAGEHFDLIYTK